MSDQPNTAAAAEDFEFQALQEARNYRQALFQEFDSFLRGDVLEVGAGIGQMTEVLVSLPAVKRVLAVEPKAAFCARHRQRHPAHEIVQGTIANLPPGGDWDAILSINVLEHIRTDETELASYANLLRKRAGCLCLFVPARPEIYAPIDQDFGHFRRYTRPELRRKLSAAGFEIVRLSYFNFPGYFAWWLNFRLLKKRGFEVAKVRFFDRVIFPVTYRLESRLLRPPFGQSLIAVARAGQGEESRR
jgi:SAM-dependent methyltransferase